MQPAVSPKSERIAPPLAEVGLAYNVTQIKRDLAGQPRWKRFIFYWLWLPLCRFVSCRLELPVMIKMDGPNACWTEHRGDFTSKDLAVQAINGRPDMHWTEVPVGALNSERTGRLGRQDTPGASTTQYKRANRIHGQTETCPFTLKKCNPDATIGHEELEALFCEGDKTYQMLVNR